MSLPVGGANLPGGLPPAAPRPSQGSGIDFAAVLADKLRVSAHAAQRLAGVDLPPKIAAAVSGAVDKAAAKGARESLIVLPNIALVVNVPNRTVITAVSGERMREGVFTNIDSAVIL